MYSSKKPKYYLLTCIHTIQLYIKRRNNVKRLGQLQCTSGCGSSSISNSCCCGGNNGCCNCFSVAIVFVHAVLESISATHLLGLLPIDIFCYHVDDSDRGMFKCNFTPWRVGWGRLYEKCKKKGEGGLVPMSHYIFTLLLGKEKCNLIL